MARLFWKFWRKALHLYNFPIDPYRRRKYAAQKKETTWWLKVKYKKFKKFTQVTVRHERQYDAKLWAYTNIKTRIEDPTFCMSKKSVPFP